MSKTTSRLQAFFTINEVALHLRVSTKTVRRLIIAGRLRTHLVGRLHRIAEEDLLSYEAARRR